MTFNSRGRIAIFLALFIAVSVYSYRKIIAGSNQGPVPPSTTLQRADRFGVYNWNINDAALPSDGSIDRLNWAAERVAEMGTRTIRVAISPRNDYGVNPAGAVDLVDIARSPAYDKLFRDSRFQTILLTAYPKGAVEISWANGFTPQEYAAERDEIKRLGNYLLGQPAFAGKTFIIMNWEGDNAIYQPYRQSFWDDFTSWIKARAEGVRLARESAPPGSTRLYSGLEFNKIRGSSADRFCGDPAADPVNEDPLVNRCVIDYVAPRVEVDYYSYSFWQSSPDRTNLSTLNLKARFKSDLDFALAKVRSMRPEITESNFMMGEVGFDRVWYGECYAANALNEVFDAFDGDGAFHASYIIFWQIIDNAATTSGIGGHYGLLRANGSTLEPTLVSDCFQKRIAGQAIARYEDCPRVRQAPDPPGVLTQQGTTNFILNPDSAFSIYASNCCVGLDTAFSPSGNKARLEQNARNFEMPSDNPAFFFESPTQINFSLPAGRRPGPAWVYVTDAAGRESNAQEIQLNCDNCPRISPCGVLETATQTLQLEPGGTVTVKGEQLSGAGNTVVIEQYRSKHLQRKWSLSGAQFLSESTSQIVMALPADLDLGAETLLYVQNSLGVGSSETSLALSAPCVDCPPRLRPCDPLLNLSGGNYSVGSKIAVRGRFPLAGNKIVIEQYDQYSKLYQQTLGAGAAGWSETKTQIEFLLPVTLFPGRTLISVMDPTGRETRGLAFAISPNAVTSVSAASYKGPSIAAEAIISAFGTSLATGKAYAEGGSLPTTLGGTQVTVRDSAGVDRLAPLFFVFPSQVNYQTPPGTAPGPASITIKNGDNVVSQGTARIVGVAPGVFSANSTGSGVAAAVAVRIRGDGSQSYESIAAFDTASGRVLPIPINLGPATDRVFLSLFGTGVRGLSGVTGASATLGSAPAQVSFAGSQPSLIGVDQINVEIPRQLSGRGEIDVILTIDGLQTNAVRISIQ